jgi:hypothetical protein
VNWELEVRGDLLMDIELIDRIYEAAFVPDLWPDVLDSLASLSESAAAALFVFADGQPTRGRAVESQRELLAEFLVSDTYQFSTGVRRMCSVQPASFLDVDGFLTPEEIQNDPMRIYFRSIGIGAHLCTAIPMPSGELAIYVLQKRLHEGRHDPAKINLLDTLRPHLARASLMAARLKLEEAKGTVAAMAAMGLPAAIFSANGHVVTTNSLLDDMPTIFLPIAFGGMAIGDANANELFQLAIKEMHSESTPAVRSIPVAADRERMPMIIHVIPLRRSAHDIFSGSDILIAANAVSASALVPDPNILSGLFDLTPAEARLATALTTGLSLRAAASEQGIQFSSGRTYLEKIFAKTGTHQQSELVALLKSAKPFSG